MASPRQKMGRARDNAVRCRNRAGKPSNRWRLTMRKIRIIEQISLDGVIQAPGGRDEDGDYAPGGWAMLYFDTAIARASPRRRAGDSIYCLAAAPTISGPATGRRSRTIR